MWIFMVVNKGKVGQEGRKMDGIKLNEMRNWEQLSGPGNSEGETEHRERGDRQSPRERECDRESGGRPLGEFNRSGTSLSSSVMGPRLSSSEEGPIHFTIGTLDTPPPERACDSSLCGGTPDNLPPQGEGFFYILSSGRDSFPLESHVNFPLLLRLGI
jgi:hypothetical protein